MIPNLMDPSANGEQKQYKSFIEQAANPNYCFLCGALVLSPANKCSFKSEQKGLLSGTSLLGLLSAVLNDRVTTDRAVVELCLSCSQLVSETDVAFMQFDKLKSRMAHLFRSNHQPKLTYQMLSQNNLNGLLPKASFETRSDKTALQVALEELAKTRPRKKRGVHSRLVAKDSSSDQVTELVLGDVKSKSSDPNETPSIRSTRKCPQLSSFPGDNSRSGAKKFGRPRKPFRCSYCRLRFISEACLSNHVAKNHSHLLSSSTENKKVHDKSYILNPDDNPVPRSELWIVQKPDELNMCSESTFSNDPTTDFSTLSTNERELPSVHSRNECQVSLPFLHFSSSSSVMSMSTTPSKLESSKLSCNISGSLETPLKLNLCGLSTCSTPSSPVIISFHSSTTPAIAPSSSPPGSGPSSPSLFSSSAIEDLYTVPSPNAKAFFSSELEDLYKDPSAACSKIIDSSDAFCDTPSIVVASEVPQTFGEEGSFECVLTSSSNAVPPDGCVEQPEENSTQVVKPISEDQTLDLTSSSMCASDELAASACSFPVTIACSNTMTAMRRIQPRPHTIKRTEPDGSVMFILGSISGTLAPSVIKVSPEYIQGLPKTCICEVCGAAFGNQRSVVMHKNSAHGKKKHSSKLHEKSKGIRNVYLQQLDCFKCGEVCSSEGSLQQHKLSCHGPSMLRIPFQYTCSHCGKPFNSKFDYDEHLKIHKKSDEESIVKKYKCGVCGLQTGSKVSLRVHVTRLHRSLAKRRVSKLACSQCTFKSSSANALSHHIRKHNSNLAEPSCSVGDGAKLESHGSSNQDRMLLKSSSESSRLLTASTSDHSRQRCFLCSVCRRIFPSTDHLRQHHESHHPEAVGKNRVEGLTDDSAPSAGGSARVSYPGRDFRCSASEYGDKKEGHSPAKGHGTSAKGPRSFFSIVKTIDGIQWMGNTSSSANTTSTSNTSSTRAAASVVNGSSASGSLIHHTTTAASAISAGKLQCEETQPEQVSVSQHLPLLSTTSSATSLSTSPMLSLEGQAHSNLPNYSVTEADPSLIVPTSQYLWSTNSTRSDLPVKLLPCVTQRSKTDNTGSSQSFLRSYFHSCSPTHRDYQNILFKLPSSGLESPLLYCVEETEDDAGHQLGDTVDVGNDDL